MRIYDPRLGRFLSVDPKAALLPSFSPYVFCLNNPISIIDPNGAFPILVNGRVSSVSERGSASYWDGKILSTITKQTGYAQSSFKFVDGDKGFWSSTRLKAGIAQGKTDAAGIYATLKETMKDGQITEQLQFVTHSRGGEFGNGYMQGVSAEVIKLAAKDGIGFSYGKDNIVEYSANLAPHQSNNIDYKNTGSKNVNVSHVGDPFSGNDAAGNVINVQSIPEKDAGPITQHGSASFNKELNFILNILESKTDKSKLVDQIKAGYKSYDNNRTNGDKSKVTQGSN